MTDSADSSQVKTMREEEEKLKKKYGGMLPNKKDVLKKRLKGSDKKYFDSADWAKEMTCEGSKEEATPASSATVAPPSGEISLDQTSFPPDPHHAPLQN